MKIAEVCEFYSETGGGVRNYIHQKFEFFAGHGHELTVIAPGIDDKIEARHGGKIRWVKAPFLPVDHHYRMFWRAEDVWRALNHEAPDVVEGSSPWRGGWIVARWPGRAAKMLFMHSDPVASYPHTLLAGLVAPDVIDRMFGWFWRYLRRLNACFDGSVVTSAWLAERFAQHGLKQLHVVPFGVDRLLFGPDRRNESVRCAMLAECGLGPEAALFVNVGRHHPEKRLGLVIDAVGQAQRVRPIGLYIVGDGYSHARVRAKAAQAKHVHVAGRIDDRKRLARMIASADALVHGCASETYGFVVAEALCAGTPVVTPSAGGAGELTESAYGATFAPGNAKAAADAMLRLLARDRAQLSQAALGAAHLRIGDMDSHFEKLLTLYARIEAQARAARSA